MTSPILLAGGTGTLGRLVAPLVRDAVGELRVLTRGPRTTADGLAFVTGDLSRGQGIAAAVEGIGRIVHCAAAPRAMARRPRSWSKRSPRAECGTWSTSRSSAPNGFRW